MSREKLAVDIIFLQCYILATMSEEPVQPAENTTIVAITRRMLKDRPKWLSYQKIEQDTGGKVNASWLNSFANGNSNANADKVIWLYEYLTGEKLKIRTA